MEAMNKVDFPDKLYSFTTAQAGRVKAITSPSIRRTAPAPTTNRGKVYAILNSETGEGYIGKTTAAFASRIYSHVYSANHPEKLPGQRRLAIQLRKHPEKFQFTLLKKSIAVRELSFWERQFIETFKPSLNMAKGGGGGVSCVESASEKPTGEVHCFNTPKKYYSVKRNLKGRVNVLLTPSKRNERNTIYVFKNKHTGQRLIGRTGQHLHSRVAQYHWTINSQKSDRNDQFRKDILEKPDDFEFGILAISNTPYNLDSLEMDYIAGKKSNHENFGYNRNKGGGGSTVSLLPKRLDL